MTLFHNPERTINNKSTEFSLLSSLNWIYFQQHTVNQFPNKKIHPLSKHQQYSKNNKVHIHIYTFSNNKSCLFQFFECWCLFSFHCWQKEWRQRTLPTLIKVTIVKFSFFLMMSFKSGHLKTVYIHSVLCVCVVLCGRPLNSRKTSK